jgi:hypothetical protein
MGGKFGFVAVMVGFEIREQKREEVGKMMGS